LKKSPLADVVSVTLRNKNKQELLTSALGFLVLANLLGVTGYLNAQASKNKKTKQEKHEVSEELLSTPEASEINKNNASNKYKEKPQDRVMLMEEKTISEEEEDQKTDRKNTPKHDFRKKHCVEKFKPLVWRFPPK